MPAKLLIIGLDGFDPSLASLWIDKGFLPNLAKIKEQGFFSPLASTVPPFTYPAWSTFMTGVNPGKHGIFDFAERIPDTYSIQYINSSYRMTPTLFDLISQKGGMVGAMGIPTTYPPSPVNGFMISGFDSPVAVNADPTFCHPRSLYKELEKRGTKYTLAGIQEITIHKNWHSDALEIMFRLIKRRLEIAQYLLNKNEYDIFSIVFSESDTVSHHFWSFHDENSPRRDQQAHKFDHAIRNIYIALDNAIGKLLQTNLPGGDCLIISDHGFGGTGRHTISINRLLEKFGFLKFKRIEQQNRGLKVNNLLKWVPTGIQEMLFRKMAAKIPALIESSSRFKSFARSETIAFSEELNYAPSIWLHDTRFPEGKKLTGTERTETIDKIRTTLLSYKDPVSGQPIIRKIHLKDQIYSGEHLDRIPDLILELNERDGYSFQVQRELIPGDPIGELPVSEWIGRKGGSMNGSHRPFGVLFGIGPGIRQDVIPQSPHLKDLAPTCLKLLDYPVPSYMDGRVLDEIIVGIDRTEKPDSDEYDLDHHTPAPSALKDSNEIRKRLEDLGYI